VVTTELSPPDLRLPAKPAALTGVLAAAAALAAGHLVAGLAEPLSSPLVAVGNAAIDLTPGWLKDFAVDVFYTWDKVALVVGMALVLAGLGVLAGLASRRSELPGIALVVLLGVVGIAAVASRGDIGQLGYLAPVASIVVGVATFRFLHRVLRTGAIRLGASPDRRAFLRASAGVAVGAGLGALGGEVGGRLLGTRVDVEGSRTEVGVPVPSEPPVPLPAGVDFAEIGTPRFITPNRDFYQIHTALVPPRIRAQDWRLRLYGMVERELVLDYDNIRSRRLVQRPVTLACVSNEVGGDLISTADFVGVPMRELLLEAGVRPGVEQVFATSHDGWTCGTPVEAMLDPARGALLAIGMNGEPLPAAHGFPARVVVPGLYGYVSATKWVVDLELTTLDAREGYWTPRGWSPRGPIKTQSRVDVPRAGKTVSAGRVVLAGVAWAQQVGIDAVEVQVDDGEWRTATLSTEVGIQTWRMWRAEVELSAGEHRVRVRATDRRGQTQTEAVAPPAPDGATGWHEVSFTVS
jgi:DMSO/TMAO reductase YedYZ molybdopterin-dependent catalytic subunit